MGNVLSPPPALATPIQKAINPSIFILPPVASPPPAPEQFYAASVVVNFPVNASANTLSESRFGAVTIAGTVLLRSLTNGAVAFPTGVAAFTQVLTPQSLFEIVDANPNDGLWSILCYDRAAALGAVRVPASLGYDQTGKVPYQTLTFTAVKRADGSFDRLLVEESGAVFGARKFEYAWLPDVAGNPSWSLRTVVPGTGTDNTVLTQSTFVSDSLGLSTLSLDAASQLTTTVETVNAGKRTVTASNAANDVRVEMYRVDGSLESTTGTAVYPSYKANGHK